MSDVKQSWEDVNGDGGVLKVLLRAGTPGQEGTDAFPVDGEELHINYTGKAMVFYCVAPGV